MVQIISSSAASCKIKAVGCESAKSALITCRFKYMLGGGVFTSYSYFRVYVSPSGSGGSGNTSGSGSSSSGSASSWGSCGSNLLWRVLGSESSDLKITGSGSMYNYQSKEPNWGGPWNTKIAHVILPEGITSLGKYAFYCRPIYDINFPESLTHIGEGCFKSTMAYYPIRPFNNQTLTLPINIAYIGPEAFFENYFKTVIIPGNGGVDIDHDAFYNCHKLETVTIGTGAKSIGDYAFYGCYNLKSVSIPTSVTSIGKKAFGYCHEDLELIVEKGSVAEEYAAAYGIEFISVGQ